MLAATSGVQHPTVGSARIRLASRVVAHSNQPVAWHCEVCGHKWTVTPDRRLSKKQAGCPKCADDAKFRKRTQHPTFADSQDPRARACLAQWDHECNAPQGNFPHNTRLQSHKLIFWICHKCPAGQDHSWSAMLNKRTGRSKTGCPLCAGQAACKCNSLLFLHLGIAAE